MKDTLIIAFNGGAYGTYLEWAINTLMSQNPIENPFTVLGNSHNSKLGHHFGTLENFLKYAHSDRTYATGRIHPKTNEHEDLGTNLNILLSHIDRLIMLYPDRSHYLMCVCNYMTKIWKDHYYDGAMAYMNPDDLYKNYPIDPDTDLRNIPDWIMREHMSFNLFSSWEDQVEWYFPDKWQHPKVKTITTKDLFDDFESILEQVMNFWERDSIRNISDLRPYHDKMLSIQPHLGKDQLCDRIIQSVLGHTNPWYWGDLCMISQAWIQLQLRQRGYEIRCHDLNDFPQDTEHLISLIYQV